MAFTLILAGPLAADQPIMTEPAVDVPPGTFLSSGDLAQAATDFLLASGVLDPLGRVDLAVNKIVEQGRSLVVVFELKVDDLRVLEDSTYISVDRDTLEVQTLFTRALNRSRPRRSLPIAKDAFESATGLGDLRFLEPPQMVYFVDMTATLRPAWLGIVRHRDERREVVVATSGNQVYVNEVIDIGALGRAGVPARSNPTPGRSMLSAIKTGKKDFRLEWTTASGGTTGVDFWRVYRQVTPTGGIPDFASATLHQEIEAGLLPSSRSLNVWVAHPTWWWVQGCSEFFQTCGGLSNPRITVPEYHGGGPIP